MPKSVTESTVEDAALHWFEGMGYSILHGPDIAPGEPSAQRADFSEVVLANRLRSALSRLNPSIPESALDEALRKITWTETPSLVKNNRRFHRPMTDGADKDAEELVDSGSPA
jgi:type I restriction enzyme R subunit